LAQQDDFSQAGEGRSVRQELVLALSDLGMADYEIDRRVEDGLPRAGMDRPDRPVCELSGGWRKRLSILCQVAREPDLLLLDEPTNHLDLEGVLWLEEFLQSANFAFVVISHDRNFIENITNRTIELNPMYRDGFLSVKGSYSEFLQAREEYMVAQKNEQQNLASK